MSAILAGSGLEPKNANRLPLLPGPTRPFDVRLPRQSKEDKEIITVVQPDICIICDASKLDRCGYYVLFIACRERNYLPNC